MSGTKRLFGMRIKYCGIKEVNPVPNLECSRLIMIYFNFLSKYYDPKKTRHAPVHLALQAVKYSMRNETLIQK